MQINETILQVIDIVGLFLHVFPPDLTREKGSMYISSCTPDTDRSVYLFPGGPHADLI